MEPNILFAQRTTFSASETSMLAQTCVQAWVHELVTFVHILSLQEKKNKPVFDLIHM